ncbi:aminopeptidase Ey-like isoform 2-T2 [Pholidichthys leucotaenia]
MQGGDMRKGFYISKVVAAACVVAAIGAVATIIALSVVYAQEKSKNLETPAVTTTKSSPSSSITTTTASSAIPSSATSTSSGSTPLSTTPSTPKEPWHHYRLPNSLAPISYNVTLQPRLTPNAEGLYIFSGHSAVAFTCVNETDLILIHSNKLNLTIIDGHLATLTGLDGTSAPSLRETWLEVPTQYLVVQLSSPLQVGSSYELVTEFVGELADDLGGFYRSEYKEDGVLKIVATTQMQATEARKAFPCFDEPAMKAVFHMTLIHPQGTVALSNSMSYDPVIILGPDGENLTVTKFEPTELMSTYLLAFVVCDFTYIGETSENILIRIWARRKAIEEGQGDYALSKTGPILTFFEDYYNITYPLKKSDQIALPDFGAGAMENWGLVTYRETALLYNPGVSSNGDKEWVATVISHELAHMWFGNLVTTRWWNDLWLNEGFATYVSYLGSDYAEPTWNMKDLIVLNNIIGVMAVDALATSHPLSSKEEDIQKPADISALFDSITYSKGAAVLRMLSEFITEDVFSEGLHTYLQEFKYRNTVYNDLWRHLQMEIPVINRAQIIDDAFNLARAKMVDTILALRTTKFLDEEVEYMPWETASRSLDYFYLMFDRTEVYGSLKAYINKQVTPLFNYFEDVTENWTKIPDNHTDQYNQVNAISVACRMGVKGCKELTTGWFKEWMQNPSDNKINPNLKSTVYCSAIAEGGEEEWDFAWGMYKNATLASEANKLMSALSCTRQPWLLSRYLQYSIDPDKIRKQDATYIIVYVARNPIGQPLAWDFIRANWDHLFNNYGGGLVSFGRIIDGVTQRFSTEFEYKQLLQFKEENIDQLGSATLALEQVLERTRANINWVALNKEKVFNWFTSEAPPKI